MDCRLIVLDEQAYNNAGLSIPLAPSDTAVELIKFLERNRKEWGLAKDVFIDCAARKVGHGRGFLMPKSNWNSRGMFGIKCIIR